MVCFWLVSLPLQQQMTLLEKTILTREPELALPRTTVSCGILKLTHRMYSTSHKNTKINVQKYLPTNKHVEQSLLLLCQMHH